MISIIYFLLLIAVGISIADAISFIPSIHSPRSGCFTLANTNPCRSILPASSAGFSLCHPADYNSTDSSSSSNSTLPCPWFPSVSCSRDAEFVAELFPNFFRIAEILAPTVNNSIPSCAQKTAALLCATLYRSCDTVDAPPILPCSSLLSEFSSSCPASVAAALEIAVSTSAPIEFSAPISLKYLFNSTNYNDSVDCSAAIPLNPVPPMPTCARLSAASGSFCSQLIDWPVYVPPGLSIPYLERVFASYLPLFNLVSEVPRGSASSCLAQTARLLCGTVFPACNTSSAQSITSLPIPFPSFPCASICSDMRLACDSTLKLFPSLGIPGSPLSCIETRVLPPFSSCDDSWSLPEQLDFPVSETKFGKIPIQCFSSPLNISRLTNSGFSSSDPFASLVKCPLPLLRPQPGSPTVAGTNCALPCRSISIPQSSWDASEPFVRSLSIVSFILASFMLLTYALFEEKRQEFILREFIFSEFCMALVLFLSMFQSNPGGNQTFTGCKSMTESIVQSDPSSPVHDFCVFQSIFMMFFGHSVANFWLILAIDIFMRLCMKIRFSLLAKKRLKWIYYGIGYGLSFFFTIFAIGYGFLGRSSVSSWCFINDSALENADFHLFYTPLSVRALVGLTCFAMIFRELTLSTALLAQKNRLTPQSRRYYWRLLGFVLLFLIIFSFLFVYRVYIAVNRSSFAESAQEYVSCLLSNDPASCGSAPAKRISYSLWLIVHFIIHGQATLCFLLFFAPQYRVWELWRNSIRSSIIWFQSFSLSNWLSTVLRRDAQETFWKKMTSGRNSQIHPIPRRKLQHQDSASAKSQNTAGTGTAAGTGTGTGNSLQPPGKVGLADSALFYRSPNDKNAGTRTITPNRSKYPVQLLIQSDQAQIPIPISGSLIPLPATAIANYHPFAAPPSSGIRTPRSLGRERSNSRKAKKKLRKHRQKQSAEFYAAANSQLNSAPLSPKGMKSGSGTSGYQPSSDSSQPIPIPLRPHFAGRQLFDSTQTASPSAQPPLPRALSSPAFDDIEMQLNYGNNVFLNNNSGNIIQPSQSGHTRSSSRSERRRIKQLLQEAKQNES